MYSNAVCIFDFLVIPLATTSPVQFQSYMFSIVHAISLSLTLSNEREIGGMEAAHDSFVWSLSWHPLGHFLVSGSNDTTRCIASSPVHPIPILSASHT